MPRPFADMGRGNPPGGCYFLRISPLSGSKLFRFPETPAVRMLFYESPRMGIFIMPQFANVAQRRQRRREMY